MSSRTLVRSLCLASAGLMPLAATGQQISSIQTWPERAAVGEPVEIRVHLAAGQQPAGCGLRLTLGDGAVRQLRVDQTEWPVRLSHTYRRGGDFTVQASGELYRRGLRTALACRGEAIRTQVSIVGAAAPPRPQARVKASPPKVEERAAASPVEEKPAAPDPALPPVVDRSFESPRAREEREEAERKAALEAQEKALQEREADASRQAAQRERELAERTEALRRREAETAAREEALKVREQAAREEALKAREKAAHREPAKEPAKKSAQARAPATASSGSSSKPPPASARGTLDAF